MIDLLQDTRTVKLTVGKDEKVWAMHGGEQGRSTGMTIGEFLQCGETDSRRLTDSSAVRVPGLRCNLPLLIGLAFYQSQGRIGSVEVCSPWCAGSRADCAEPGILLYAARNFDSPISVGGWHKVTQTDFRAFILSLAVSKDQPGQVLIDLASKHPVWPLLLWVSGLDLESAARLMGEIVDPRWFIDPVEPDRSNKLRQYLGMDPKSHCGTDLTNARVKRNRMVLSCWQHRDESLISVDLQRSRQARGGWRGDLAASRRFVEFVRQVWLAVLCRSRPFLHHFAPEHFFRQKEEAKAFTTYVKNLL